MTTTLRDLAVAALAKNLAALTPPTSGSSLAELADAVARLDERNLLGLAVEPEADQAHTWPEGITLDSRGDLMAVRRNGLSIGAVYNSGSAGTHRVISYVGRGTRHVGDAADFREGVALLLSHIEAERGKPVADLRADDLGKIVQADGHQGRLVGISADALPGSVALILADPDDDHSRAVVIVKPGMTARVIAGQVTA